MWIMIAGPYRHGSTDPKKWEDNHKKMNKLAYRIYKKGHIPIIGVNVALPIIETVGFDKYEDLMMPISLAMAERCDAILRIGGASTGADQEVEIFENKGLSIYYSLEDISKANKE